MMILWISLYKNQLCHSIVLSTYTLQQFYTIQMKLVFEIFPSVEILTYTQTHNIMQNESNFETYRYWAASELFSSLGLLNADEINQNPGNIEQVFLKRLLEEVPDCLNEHSVDRINEYSISLSNVIYKLVAAEGIHVIRELLLRSCIIHRNILHIHSKLHLEKHYIVQEHYQYTLRELRKQKKCNWIAMAIGLCYALIYLHAKGIFTSNLNPDTLVVDSNKNILISELFPISQIQPKYLAPEQLHFIDRSEESDSWTVGCIIVFLLTGDDPFNDLPEQQEEFKNAILDKSQLKRVIDQEELRLVRKLLSKVFIYKRSKRASLLDIFKYLNKLN